MIWGGEFGRTPTVELPTPGSNAGKINGRDHNHHGFTMWMAGGGVKGGYVHGATDEFGFQAVENKVHVHDLHATILQLLGFDHEKLTFRYAGRDFRLTDVHGKVVIADSARVTFRMLDGEDRVPKRGEVWLVDMGMVEKVRPALILSGPLRRQ